MKYFIDLGYGLSLERLKNADCCIISLSIYLKTISIPVSKHNQNRVINTSEGELKIMPTTYGPQDPRALMTGVSYWQSRDDHFHATGQHAAPYNPAMHPKNWVANNPTGNPTDPWNYLFIGLDPNNNPAVVQGTMTVQEAATLNLPGVDSYGTYAAWVVGRSPVPAGTYLGGSFFGTPYKSPVPVDQLFYEAEVKALAAKISSDTGQPTTYAALKVPFGSPTNNSYSFTYDPTDGRMVYAIQIGANMNTQFPVGSNPTQGLGGGLFYISSTSGVDYPGTWTWDPKNTVISPKWTASPAPPNPTTTFGPIPINPLNANQTLVATLMGIVISDSGGVNPTPVNGGGLTSDEHAALFDVQSKVTTIQKALSTVIPPA